MEIIVEVKDVYGKPLVYPVSREAIMFAKIAESKTLTPRVLLAVEMLGFDLREFGHTTSSLRIAEALAV